MPPKYSHVKKRTSSQPAGASAKKGSSNSNSQQVTKKPNPHVDRNITKAMSAVSQLERAIARILLIRYEQDMARLFSTHLYCIALCQLPTFVMRCITLGGPGWVAANADNEEIKDFFRATIAMDLRQAGERVATKSVLWSYTALRHFAMSNNVSICNKRGLHSLRLLPHFSALRAHLETLETMPPPSFSKPPHLGPLSEGLAALEDACELKYNGSPTGKSGKPSSNLSGKLERVESDWRCKVRVGYERITQTLWRVAREFDVRGYGLVLREKLTSKWCDCGCSTDHLGEVCERTVREDEEESGIRPGKEREWDGRGAGVYGWETEEEEDVWEIDLDFNGPDPESNGKDQEPEMSIGELMEWRFMRAEKEKEQGNTLFRKGDYLAAIKHYTMAHEIEPELPHYQLNLAAAYIKLDDWIAAEKACDAALGQHRSGKGYWRRAKARKMLGRTDEAIKDLRALLKLQPNNAEAVSELVSLLPPDPSMFPTTKASSSSAQPSSPARQHPNLPKLKPPKALPFDRTDADDRKLKIVALPLSYDLPITFEFMAAAAAAGFGDQNKGNNNSNGKGKMKRAQGGIQLPFLPEMFSKGKGRKISFAYPNWERYVVKRVSG